MNCVAWFLLLCCCLGTAAGQERLPSTGTAAIPEDPAYDGWETERTAFTVGDLFKSYVGALPNPSDASVFAANAQISIPDKGGTTFKPLGFIVRQWKDQSGGSTSKSVDPAAFGKFLAQPFDPGHSTKSKVKLLSIQQKGARCECELLLQLSGVNSEAQPAESHSTWDFDWIRSDDTWLIKAVKPVRFEWAVLEKKSEPLFTDQTAAVMGHLPAWQNQLQPGIDHWLERMDTRLGILVGGWTGLAVGDANGDGRDDIYVCQSGGLPNRLFLQQSDGTLADHSAASGVDWLETTRGALFLDLDNDGDQDLVAGTVEGLLIHENRGDAHFRVVGAEVLTDAPPYSLAAADYDNDGDLDIFTCGYNQRGHVDRNRQLVRPVPYHDANNGARNTLLRNEGAFRFTQVTKRVGLDAHNSRYSFAAAWEDFDLDGDPDLYVANDFGRNNLYRQHRDKAGRIHFTDIAEASGVLDIAAGMSAAWGDPNNDGWPDLYVSNMFSSAGNRIARQQRFHTKADADSRRLFLRHARGNSLFFNGGRSLSSLAWGFSDASVESGVTLGRWAWGSLFADVNNDGREDILVANGFVTHPDTGDL